MNLKGDYLVKKFEFGFKARTSRGLMPDKTSWFIRLEDSVNPGVYGIGECGPLPGLSTDLITEMDQVINDVLARISKLDNPTIESIISLVPVEFSSIRFGLETAFLDLQNGGRRIIYNNGFHEGKSLPINGLIWMGDQDFMMNQVKQKITQGFRCIKLKVGGLDFEKECQVLDYMRKRYNKENIEIRLDANGAFKSEDALYKLNELAKFEVHSIEQPITPGLPEMEELCRKTPIPVALDEELIGVSEKESLLLRIRPQFIILKPTLHGGLQSCAEWIEVARKNHIGWWITSALESNIGLNAICQFTANYQVTIPQGLGTGMIYKNNIGSPLQVEQGFIRYNPDLNWGSLQG